MSGKQCSSVLQMIFFLSALTDGFLGNKVKCCKNQITLQNNTTSPVLANSIDPDQSATEEAN